MSYCTGWTNDRAPFKASDMDLYCPYCDEVIRDGEPVEDNEVHKCGELHYIETAHSDCIPADERRRV